MNFSCRREGSTSKLSLNRTLGGLGWDGTFGTSWYVDPREEMIGALMTQRRPDMLGTPGVTLDFWTSAYQLIDD
jgi:CubicO group peptidase (beta-lactamase class C family)